MNKRVQKEIPKDHQYDPLMAIINEDSKLIHERAKEKIIKPCAILTLNDQPLIFSNTINVIEGQAGTSKSRLAETFCGALLRRNTFFNDHFIKGCSNKANHVLYVDSERNFQEQAPRAIQHIKHCAGYQIDEDIPGFEFCSLIRVPRELRLEKLTKKIREYHTQNPNTQLFVVLDLISDCILDFNEVKESLGLIDLMSVLNNTTQTVFLAIIHQNPGPANSFNKGRGHIGTELVNKSTTALELGFKKATDGQIRYYLNFKKTRNSKLYQSLVLFVDEDQTLQIDKSESANSGKRVSDIQLMQENLFELYKDDPSALVPTAELNAFMRKTVNKADSTVIKLIKKFIEEEHEVTNPDNTEVYKLVKTNLPGKSKNNAGYGLQAK